MLAVAVLKQRIAYGFIVNGGFRIKMTRSGQRKTITVRNVEERIMADIQLEPGESLIGQGMMAYWEPVLGSSCNVWPRYNFCYKSESLFSHFLDKPHGIRT